tara:strand:- start:7556 stop:8206 length:651 start_codon:yes stop_codon:yes gene_type:complete
MKKRGQRFTRFMVPRAGNRRAQFLILPIMAVIAVGVIVLAVIAIIVMPTIGNDQRGIGANGFRAYIEQDGDLGMGSIVTKRDVSDALGKKATSVKDAEVSAVFNLNGTRGQTVTYDFVRADGAEASVYIDGRFFQDSVSLKAANITDNTLSAGKVGEHNAYFLHALTFGSEREYRLLVEDGLHLYTFVMVQPYRNITISEVSAMAVLKKLAASAEF